MTKIDFRLGGTLRVVTEQEGGHCLVTVRYDNFTLTAKGDTMAYTLPVGKQVYCQVSYVDAGGNPAAVDGAVSWDSSAAAVATVVVDDTDSTQCAVQAVGTLGQAQVTATADVDLGEGVQALITTLDVSVVAGEAVAGSIEVIGAPVDIPAG
jgi:hypothetical protein